MSILKIQIKPKPSTLKSKYLERLIKKQIVNFDYSKNLIRWNLLPECSSLTGANWKDFNTIIFSLSTLDILKFLLIQMKIMKNILYFREPNNAEQSLFLPSQMIKFNNLKIILIDEQTETRYNETIEKSLIVKDFIEQFQKKSGLKNIMLFYEGVEIEEKKSFEELKIPNEAEIELQY